MCGPTSTASLLSILDGYGHSSTSFILTVYPEPTLLAITPTSGPRTGGTAISIYGTNFISGKTICVFGADTEVIPSVVENTTLLVCESDAVDLPVESVSVRVQTLAQYALTNDVSREFTYYAADRMIQFTVEPLLIYAGHTSGVYIHSKCFFLFSKMKRKLAI